MSDRTPRPGRKPGANTKGLNFENAVALQLRKAGFDQARRLGTGSRGDVRCGALLIETKHQVNPSIRGALEQCEATMGADDYSIAIAVVKKHGDRKGPILAMRWRDFLAMVGPHAREVVPW